jgi:hypothetical protein
MLVKLSVFLLMFSSQAFSGNYSTPAEFCGAINTEAKAKNPTTNHKNVIAQFATPKVASDAGDCAAIKAEIAKPDVAFIDARDKGARKSTGTFPGVAKITSDHHNAGKHHFTQGKLVKKLGKYFKKKGRAVASLDDIKGKKLVLFCNGLKCYRSSWAACDLMKMGFKKENVWVVLDGYDGLKKSCLK